MAFFDDLGKKLSQAGQSTIQKTKEMADVARINSMISDEEKKINNNYLEIGKLYVSLHSSDCESQFSGMIHSIMESEEKIKEYRQQIQDVKGVKKCEKCGAEVPLNSTFCNACGAEMPQQRAADVTQENAVQTNETQQNTYQENVYQENQPQQEENAAEITNDSVQQNKCPNCGKEVSENAAFCAECGTKL